jgi:hypothetical protein
LAEDSPHCTGKRKNAKEKNMKRTIALTGIIALMLGSTALAFDRMEQVTGSKKALAPYTAMEQVAGPNTRPVSRIEQASGSNKAPAAYTTMEQVAGPNTRPSTRME